MIIGRIVIGSYGGRWGERLIMGEMGGMDRDGGRVSLGVLGGMVWGILVMLMLLDVYVEYLHLMIFNVCYVDLMFML